MPANRGLGNPNWSAQSDIKNEWGIQPYVDERAVNIWDQNEVADCLVDSGWFEAYEFTPEVNVHDLALESAANLISNRRALLKEHEAQTQPNALEVQPEPLRTVYVPSVTRISDGERLQPAVKMSTPSRSFG